MKFIITSFEMYLTRTDRYNVAIYIFGNHFSGQPPEVRLYNVEMHDDVSEDITFTPKNRRLLLMCSVASECHSLPRIRFSLDDIQCKSGNQAVYRNQTIDGHFVTFARTVEMLAVAECHWKKITCIVDYDSLTTPFTVGTMLQIGGK